MFKRKFCFKVDIIYIGLIFVILTVIAAHTGMPLCLEEAHPELDCPSQKRAMLMNSGS
jgi:hypothetical protein